MFSVFFFNDTATTEIYTLSLHDALPIYNYASHVASSPEMAAQIKAVNADVVVQTEDRKSTRLNSSHSQISYDVFCLKQRPCGSGTFGARVPAPMPSRIRSCGGRRRPGAF